MHRSEASDDSLILKKKKKKPNKPKKTNQPQKHEGFFLMHLYVYTCSVLQDNQKKNVPAGPSSSHSASWSNHSLFFNSNILL